MSTTPHLDKVMLTTRYYLRRSPRGHLEKVSGYWHAREGLDVLSPLTSSMGRDELIEHLMDMHNVNPGSLYGRDLAELSSLHDRSARHGQPHEHRHRVAA